MPSLPAGGEYSKLLVSGRLILAGLAALAALAVGAQEPLGHLLALFEQ
jgi:hypothetical protein